MGVICKWMRRPPMTTCLHSIRKSLRSAAWRMPDDTSMRRCPRQRLRQEQALPILEKLHAYLQEQRAAALPKSPLGAASGYALRNWVALTRYAEDGRLKIDNNGA